MTDKQEATEAVETAEMDALTPEEAAFFESGGEQEIPSEETGSDVEAKKADTDAEAAEDEGKTEQARDEKGKFVPHQALHAEREEHKKTRAELQDLKEFRARMEERMQWFEKSNQQPDHQEETPPDPNEDIFAFSQWQAKQLEALNQKVTQQEQQAQQSAQQQQVEQAIWGQWENDSRTYAQENQDFGNAAKWLAETRDRQLQGLAAVDPRFSDVRARNAQIEQELMGIVASAKQNGMSSAELVYQIAQNYGYTPAEAAEAAKTEAGTDNNELSEKIKRLDAAQNASKTVGQGAGKSGGDEIDAEAVASMSEDEFNAWVSKPENARRFDKMMGG